MCQLMQQVALRPSEINKKAIRKKAARLGIFTMADLARELKCSRWSLYKACEQPTKVPRVSNRLKELLDAC